MICIAAVSWLICKTDWVRLNEVWVEADRSLIILGVLVFGPAPVFIAIRLKWLLAIHNVHLTVWQAIKVTFAGNFIIWTLPVGTPGGDSVKAYYVARQTPHKHEAVTTVFFDRVIGVLGLVLMSGVVVLLNSHNPAFARWGRIIGVLVVMLFLGGGIYYSNRLRKLFRLDRLVSRMPFATHLRRIDKAVFAFRHRIGTVFACLVLSLVLQGTVIVSVFLCGWALGMIGDRPIWDFIIYLGYTPICLLAGVMPLGVMEETFKQLLVDEAGYGAREAAYSLSLLNRAIQLLWSLPGALIVLRGGYRPKPQEVLEETDPKLEAPS
ncbi:MAG: flippase-like domain-containing protein [Planctomycetota bacterium]|nr:MAG: flippase-like domain-containing protein [Planctomycetota bacterium]